MSTTFDVFFLGTGPAIDPSEGNSTSENASAIVGTTYGSIANPLVNNIKSFAPSGAGFSGGTFDAYDSNNFSSNDQFSVDGGPSQTFDGIAEYNATITYTDGTTDTISALVMQDTVGNLYLVPEITLNADQTKLEAKPIRSLTLDSIVTNTGVMGADRYAANYAVCFTSGTSILTPHGKRLIDDLRVGDPVCTMDNGPQPIRWIGRQHLSRAALLARPKLRPVLIRRGVLGAERDLLVSPQHGMLQGRDRLLRAKHLAETPGSRVRIAHGKRGVTYIHLMFDVHQIIFAEGAPSESFYPGPIAQRMLAPMAFRELQDLFPEVINPRLDQLAIAHSYGHPARDFLPAKSLQDFLPAF